MPWTKMKGGVKAKFTVHSFCELPGAALRIWAFISVCEISVPFWRVLSIVQLNVHSRCFQYDIHPPSHTGFIHLKKMNIFSPLVITFLKAQYLDQRVEYFHRQLSWAQRANCFLCHPFIVCERIAKWWFQHFVVWGLLCRQPPISDRITSSCKREKPHFPRSGTDSIKHTQIFLSLLLCRCASKILDTFDTKRVNPG